MSFLRAIAVPLIAIALGLVAIVTVVQLQRHAEESDDAQAKLQQAKLQLTQLQNAPFKSHADTGGSPELAAGLINTGKAAVTRILVELDQDSPPPALAELGPLLKENYSRIDRIYEYGASGVGFHEAADKLAGENSAISAQQNEVLDRAGSEYEARETRATDRVTVGAVGSIVCLLAIFGFYYLRAARSRAENKALLARTRAESITDSLTGLGNRRALMEDLEAHLASATPENRVLLTLFDLDGFKHYNDTFGHPAGDILLARLGGRLREATSGSGSVYRAGGDEFCLLALLGPGDTGERLAETGNSALSEAGEGFEIGCSYGIAIAPAEASTSERAMGLADQRMYEIKAGRSSAGRQSADVLLQVLSERDSELGSHINAVAALAEPSAKLLGLSDSEVKRTHTAAELHDVGKSGIPDSILGKAGPLDDEEWAFMRRHTLIGERIIQAAPALAPAAELVRASHEWFDGSGYPDGLEGEEIPIGARIISVCDALNAMTSDRPYRKATPVAQAMMEVRRCGGTQFDPKVVDAVLTVLADPEWKGIASLEHGGSPEGARA